MDDRDEKKKKKYWVIFLLCLIIGILMLITVSYTIGSTIINIVGINNTQIVNWDIRIVNVNTSTSGMAKVSDFDVSDTMIKDFNVSFFKPGDEVSITFDIYNNGSLDASLEYFNIGKMVCTYEDGTDANDYCKNFYYIVEYADGSDIELGDTLNSGEKKKVNVILKYNNNSIAPDNAVYIDDIDISFIYGQK